MVAGLLANAVVHSAKIPSSVWALMPAFLVFFVAGFALYAFALAATGALVARQEEVQSATFPLVLPLLIGYSTSGGSSSDALMCSDSAVAAARCAASCCWSS